MKQLNITEDLYNYMCENSIQESDILKELRAETAKHPMAIMQISPLQAAFMQMMVYIHKCKNILELGTFTGYSALALAEALGEDGKVITCDIDPETTEIAKVFWKKAALTHKIELKLNPGLETMQELLAKKMKFDMIFIDADKNNYVEYYEHSLQIINRSGIILIDNVLWHGDVINHDDISTQTQTIRDLNQLIKNDDRVRGVLLPIADGLFLVQTK